MRKSTFKPLVLSALSALALAGVGVGATFALFTDKAEASIDVEAGRVQVGTNASIYKVFEYNGTAAGLEVLPTATDDYTNSIGGTTKKDAQGIFQLKNWAPGDRAQISVEATNSSNVKIKVRLKAVLTGELADALVVKIGNAEFTSVQLAAQGNRTLVTEWTELNPGSNPADFGLEVSFPNVGTEITARDEGENNLHQGQAASLLVTYEAVQGNADVATTLQEKANSILATNAVLDESNATFSEALGDLPELKADLLSSGLVYGIEEDQFYQTSEVPSGKEYKYFKPASALDSSGYSIYAKSDWATNNVNLVGIGFDAGDAVHIDTISYVGALEARTNYIVTNSLDTAITVNAPQDTIYHYGDAASVNIIAAANQSYHEFGYVPFLQVANGRVALEKDSKVDKLHFNYDAVNEKFDEIVVAYEPSVTLPVFSRDEVENIGDEGKLVVELQNHVEKEKAESDYVWLYHQGLKEQIRISDSADEAGEVKSTDEQVATNTAKLAEDIANTLQSGYEPTAEQIESGTVDTTKVEEKGLDEEQKAEVAEEAIAQAIEEKLDDDDVDYVCRVGATGYVTIQDGIMDAPDGATLVVLKDVVGEAIGTYGGQNLTIDFNGHTVNAGTQRAPIYVNGQLVGNQSTGIMLYASGNITLKNGTFLYSRAGAPAIIAYGADLVLDHMSVTHEETTLSSSLTLNVRNGASALIRDSQLTANKGNVISNSGCTITIEGDETVLTKNVVFADAIDNQQGHVIINGGRFEYAATGNEYVVKNVVSSNKPTPVIDINGGIFNSPKAFNASGTVNVSGGNFAADPRTVSGANVTGAVTHTGERWIVGGTDLYAQIKHPNSQIDGYDDTHTIGELFALLEDGDEMTLGSYVYDITAADFANIPENFTLKGTDSVIRMNGGNVIAEKGFTMKDIKVVGGFAVRGDDGETFTFDNVEIAFDMNLRGTEYFWAGSSYALCVAEGNEADIVIDEMNLHGNHFRGIELDCAHSGSEALLNYNVTITDSYLQACYPVHSDVASNIVINIEDSTLKGWNSFDKVGTLNITRCEFPDDPYAVFQPYGAATLTECVFDEAYLDACFGIGSDEVDVNLVNCKVGTADLTADHVRSMVDAGDRASHPGAIWRVNGVAVEF